MKRREFVGATLLAAAASGAGETPALSQERAEEFPSVPGLTGDVCDFLLRTRLEDIPGGVHALARKSILDALGLALAGSRSSLAPPLLQYLGATAVPGGSTVIGTPLRLAPRFAAFANGCFIHADDFDDTQLAQAPGRVYGLLTHPTVTALASALAVCEARGLTGRDLLAAYQVGVEVECKIAEAASPRHYNDGFHTTGTVGTFGAAAACARLHALERLPAQFCLGIAAAQAGGLRANFGSMMKPFHAGHAAEAGVVSADLAALGWTASPEILESKLGWFRAAAGGFDPLAIVGRLGNPWTLLAPGVSIKPHPSGSLTHPAMGEVQRLIAAHDIRAADVQEVVVGGNSRMVSTLFHHRPTNGLQAKFSMEFGVAILLLERKANLGEYTDEVVARPDVQAMIRRVRFEVDPEAEREGFDKMTSIVRIRLRDGTQYAGQAQFARGSPAMPMSFAEVADKFRGCAEFAHWPREKTGVVIDLVGHLEELRDLAPLAAALRA